MSQAGLVDIENSNPQILTQVDTDSGSAIPIANTLTIEGDVVANATYAKPIFTTGAGNTVTINQQVASAITGSPGDTNDAGIASFDDTMFTVDANGYVQLKGGSIGIDSFTTDDGNVVTADGAGNINYLGDTVPNGFYGQPLYTTGVPASNQITPNIQLSTVLAGPPVTERDAGVASFDSEYFNITPQGYVSAEQTIIDTAMANFIVDPNGTKAEYTTITAALAAASSGDTIGVKPGTYTENLTLKAGVNIVSFVEEGKYSNVVIVGKMTATYTGNVSLVGLRLKTNGDFAIATSGATVLGLTLTNCFIEASNATALSVNNANARITIQYSTCDVTGATQKLFDFAAGILNFYFSTTKNTGLGTTDSTASANGVSFYSCIGQIGMTTSSTGSIAIIYCNFDQTARTVLTANGSGTHAIRFCYFNTTSASTIVIGASGVVTISDCLLSSSNTKVIDNAGTCSINGLTFSSTSSNIGSTAPTILNEGPSRTIGSANVAGTNTLTVTNTNNSDTASSAATSILSGGASAGDPYLNVGVTSTNSYCFGIDNSDSDKLKINTTAGSSVTPSTGTNLLTMTTAGECTMPLQPAFLAYNSATDTNQTGNGATATISCDTEAFDQNLDYNNGTYTFTAPVTGIYTLGVCVKMAALTAAMTGGNIRINTTARSYQYIIGSIGAQMSSISERGLHFSCIANMTAGDTSTCDITLINGAGNTASISGAANPQTYFYGSLIC